MPSDINSNYSKLLIFHINPSNDEITKELIFGKILLAIKKASTTQHIVFLSHSNLSLLKKILMNMGIKNAYIISDAGARIFNNENNQIIFEKVMDEQTVSSAIHTGIVENNLVLVSSDKREMSYSYNFWHQATLAKKHYIKLDCTNDFPKFLRFINANSIYSVMIFNNNYEKMWLTYEKFSKIANELNFELQIGIATYFIVTEKNINKLLAIKYLMNHLKISNTENVYYYALNTYDKELLTSFKNKYVYQDVALTSDLRNKKYNFQLDITDLIHSIVKNLNTTN